MASRKASDERCTARLAGVEGGVQRWLLKRDCSLITCWKHESLASSDSRSPCGSRGELDSAVKEFESKTVEYLNSADCKQIGNF